MLENLLEITISMSAIIAVILLLTPIIDKRYGAKWRYFLWFFIVIRLIIPFNITLPKAPIAIEQTEKAVVLRTENGNLPVAVMDNSYEELGNYSPSSGDYAKIISLNDLLIGIWLVGMIIFISYCFINYALFRIKLKPNCKFIESEELKEVSEKLKLRKAPKLAVCDNIASPMMIGFFSSLILLPKIDYSDSELEVILKHELTHYKRKDLWYKLFLMIANGVHWFNPFVYFMVRQANRDLEYSCDDLVVKDTDIKYRKDYSMTILKSMEESRATALSTYLSKAGADEKKRFNNILNDKNKKKGIIALVIVLIIVLIAGGVIGLKTISTRGNVEFLSDTERKEYYINFAMDNRIDFIPNFDEGKFAENDEVSSEDFLMFTYYIKKDELSEDSIMSKELVQEVMRNYFGIEKVAHNSLRKMWDYIPEEGVYKPIPQGTAEKKLFDVREFNVYKKDGKNIYDVKLYNYQFPFIMGEDSSDEYDDYFNYSLNSENFYVDNVNYLLSKKGEDIKNNKSSVYNALSEMIIEGNAEGFTKGNIIRIKYYIQSKTGEPVFIYKGEEPFEIN